MTDWDSAVIGTALGAVAQTWLSATTATSPQTSQTTATTDCNNVWQQLAIGAVATATVWFATNIFTQAFTQWFKIPRGHSPENFMFVPGKEAEGLGPTQRLAPLDEMLEIDGLKPVREHLEKMLNDVAYREEQMRQLNRINKETNRPEVQFNEQLIHAKLNEILLAYSPVNRWRVVAHKFAEKRADENAERLFNEVFTPEEVLKLEADKKILISRNGFTFELGTQGEITQLLPDGQKQKWCLIAKGTGLPLKDVLIMKKLLLEHAPEMVVQVANKINH